MRIIYYKQFIPTKLLTKLTETLFTLSTISTKECYSQIKINNSWVELLSFTLKPKLIPPE